MRAECAVPLHFGFSNEKNFPFTAGSARLLPVFFRGAIALGRVWKKAYRGSSVANGAG
jgi:hypothetical protein